MVLVYVGMGLVLFMYEGIEELFQITHQNRLILGSLIWGYGIFKLYRVIKKRRKVSLENEED